MSFVKAPSLDLDLHAMLPLVNRNLHVVALGFAALSFLRVVHSLPSLAIDNATFVPALGTGGTYKYLAIPYALRK